MQAKQPKVIYKQLKDCVLKMLANYKIEHGNRAFTIMLEELKQFGQEEFQSGNYGVAAPVLKLIVELCLENTAEKNEETIATALVNLLVVFEKQGESSYQESRSFFLEYRGLIKEIYKSELNLPLLYIDYCLGVIAFNGEEYNEAQHYSEEVLTKHNAAPGIALKNPILAEVYANLGALLVRKEQFKKGQEYLQKALLIIYENYPDNDKKIIQIKDMLNFAVHSILDKQKGYSLTTKHTLLGEEKLIDQTAFKPIPPCQLEMAIINNQVVFQFSGDSDSVYALRQILASSNGLLDLMNQSSQYGLWSLQDLLPEHYTKKLSDDVIRLYYCSKVVYQVYKDNFSEEYHIRKKNVESTFDQHRSHIWYTALVELSGYLQLPFLNRIANFLHGNIRKLDEPKDEGVAMEIGDVKYVMNQDTDHSSIFNDTLTLLSRTPPHFDKNSHLTKIFQQLAIASNEILEQKNTTKNELEKIVITVDHHLAALKRILFRAYSGNNVFELALNDWLTIVNYLRLLNLLKTDIIRQQSLILLNNNEVLIKKANLEQQFDYEKLQESKLLLLDGKPGPLIIADENYPERQPKGWPFSRTLEKIERLHGSWNTRSTLSDDKVFSKEQNRFDFSKLLKMYDIFVDFGCGNARLLDDLRRRFRHLNLYLVGVARDQVADQYLASIDEMWYMSLPLANNIQAFAERFKNKVGLVTCTFGAATYSNVPHKVVVLAAYLLRKGGHFSAIISSQPGHYDGTPLGYADTRKKLAAFLKKLGLEMTSRMTSIQSEVVPDAKPIDCKLDIVRPLDAPEITYTLEELFDMADAEIGIPNKLKAPPNHPYKFKTQSIEMRDYRKPNKPLKNNILELEHIKKTSLEIKPIKDFGVVFQILLDIGSAEELEKLYQKVNHRLTDYLNDQVIPTWSVEKNTANQVLTISYLEATSRYFSLMKIYSQYLSYLTAGSETIKNAWIGIIEDLLFNGIVIPGITDVIDSFQYPVLPKHISVPSQYPRGLIAPAPISFNPPLHMTMKADAPVPHVETGEPIFTFHLVGQEEGYPIRTLGSVSFYGVPFLCRDDAGRKNNLLNADGIFQNVTFDNHQIADICPSLPPTFTDKLKTSAKEGYTLGLFTGATKVFRKNLDSYPISNPLKTLMAEIFFYFNYFIYRCLDSYFNSNKVEGNTYQALYQALVDTLSLLFIALLVGGTQKLLSLASQYTSNYQWNNTSKGLDQIKKCVGWTLFGHRVTQNGLIPTLTSIGAGVATQTMVEKGAEMFTNPKLKQA